MDLPISDFEVEGDSVVIYTDKQHFAQLQTALADLHYHMLESDIQFLPENTVTLTPEGVNKLYTLLDTLEEDEDVDQVRHNMGN